MTTTTPTRSLSQHCQLVLDYLKSGRTLTNQIALNSLGVGSLSRRVTDLKERGVKVKKAWAKDHFGNRYLKYSLDGSPKV